MHANNFFSNQLDCCCCGSSMSFVPCFQAQFFFAVSFELFGGCLSLYLLVFFTP